MKNVAETNEQPLAIAPILCTKSSSAAAMPQMNWITEQ
jgi:hypothetical protein